MSVPRIACAAGILTHDRHQATDSRWLLTAPDGRETVLCSAACVLSWVVAREWPGGQVTTLSDLTAGRAPWLQARKAS